MRRSSRIKQRHVGQLPADLAKYDATKDKNKPGSVWAVLDGDTGRAVLLSSPTRASGIRGWAKSDAIQLMAKCNVISTNKQPKVTLYFQVTIILP